MVEILIGASLIAAFLAGIAALFAPCCITVLLPAYLGSIFRQKRTLILMTFVFFLGLLVVFLPLGLGIAAIGQLAHSFHDAIFIIGGVFMLLLGVSILLGKHFSIPMHFTTNSARVKVQGAGSVFALGVFSGFATLCCAPVLAGVLALAVLPGSVLLGGIYAFVYVLGMVTPLFIIATFLDKVNFTKKFGVFRRHISYRLGKWDVSLSFADVLSGATFSIMGVLILYLAETGQLSARSPYLMTVDSYVAGLAAAISSITQGIPDVFIITFFAAIFALILWSVYRVMKKTKSGTSDNPNRPQDS